MYRFILIIILSMQSFWLVALAPSHQPNFVYHPPYQSVSLFLADRGGGFGNISELATIARALKSYLPDSVDIHVFIPFDMLTQYVRDDNGQIHQKMNVKNLQALNLFGKFERVDDFHYRWILDDRMIPIYLYYNGIDRLNPNPEVEATFPQSDASIVVGDFQDSTTNGGLQYYYMNVYKLAGKSRILINTPKSFSDNPDDFPKGAEKTMVFNTSTYSSGGYPIDMDRVDRYRDWVQKGSKETERRKEIWIENYLKQKLNKIFKKDSFWQDFIRSPWQIIYAQKLVPVLENIEAMQSMMSENPNRYKDGVSIVWNLSEMIQQIPNSDLIKLGFVKHQDPDWPDPIWIYNVDKTRQIRILFTHGGVDLPYLMELGSGEVQSKEKIYSIVTGTYSGSEAMAIGLPFFNDGYHYGIEGGRHMANLIRDILTSGNFSIEPTILSKFMSGYLSEYAPRPIDKPERLSRIKEILKHFPEVLKIFKQAQSKFISRKNYIYRLLLGLEQVYSREDLTPQDILRLRETKEGFILSQANGSSRPGQPIDLMSEDIFEAFIHRLEQNRKINQSRKIPDKRQKVTDPLNVSNRISLQIAA